MYFRFLYKENSELKFILHKELKLIITFDCATATLRTRQVKFIKINLLNKSEIMKCDIIKVN